MKWIVILIFIIVNLPFGLYSQSELFLIEESGKYGYINLNGEVVVSPKYANARNFSEGLAAVRLDDKFGFIDSIGNWKIPPIYDYAKPFKNGRAYVWQGRTKQTISQAGSHLKKYKRKTALDSLSNLKLLRDKLFLIEKDKRSTYVDRSGNIVWQQKEVLDIYPYDVTNKINFKRRSKKSGQLHWLYRFFDRKPKLSIGFKKRVFKERNKKYLATNLYLMNASKDTLVFDGSMMGRLPVKIQAKDTDGKWKTISQCRGCDVIYRNAKIQLTPGRFWYFRLPKFKGYIKTEFRVVATYTKKGEPNVPLQLIKTFKGGINPAQFLNIYY